MAIKPNVTDPTSCQFTTADGRKLVFYEVVGTSESAVVYRAELQGQAGSVAFKLQQFKDDASREVTRKRITYLVGLDLADRHPCWSYLPIAIVKDEMGRYVGHVSRLAAGNTLETEMEAGLTLSFCQRIQACIALARLAELNEREGVALHQDFHSGNLVILSLQNGQAVTVLALDFDDFVTPYPVRGLPDGLRQGNPLDAAPEVQLHHRRVDAKSIRFSLTVRLLELLLGRHVTHAAGADPDVNLQLLCSGSWHDAVVGGPVPFGLPVDVLNAELIALGHRGLALNRDHRPTPSEWVAALVRALSLVRRHAACGKVSIADPAQGRMHCPRCHAEIGHFALRLPGGKVIPVQNDLTIGRAQIDYDWVSRFHLTVFSNCLDIFVKPVGKNPIFRRTDGMRWQKLENDRAVLVTPGTVLRLNHNPPLDIEVIRSNPF